MRIKCETTIANRTGVGQSVPRTRKPLHSVMSLGKNDETVFVHLSTQQNKLGDKFKVTKNIKGVLSKFLSEG